MQKFLENDFYTPADQTRLTDALIRLGQVKNRAIFVDRAAGAHWRDLAYFLVRPGAKPRPVELRISGIGTPAAKVDYRVWAGR